MPLNLLDDTLVINHGRVIISKKCIFSSFFSIITNLSQIHLLWEIYNTMWNNTVKIKLPFGTRNFLSLRTIIVIFIKVHFIVFILLFCYSYETCKSFWRSCTIIFFTFKISARTGHIFTTTIIYSELEIWFSEIKMTAKFLELYIVLFLHFPSSKLQCTQ